MSRIYFEKDEEGVYFYQLLRKVRCKESIIYLLHNRLVKRHPHLPCGEYTMYVDNMVLGTINTNIHRRCHVYQDGLVRFIEFTVSFEACEGIEYLVIYSGKKKSILTLYPYRSTILLEV